MSSVVLGGTFHSLHAGHRALLHAAASFSKITIGLTSGAFAKRMRIYPCAPYAERLKNLKSALSSIGISAKTSVVQIHDRYGPSTKDKSITHMVASEETRKTAEKINRIRKAKGMPALKLIIIPMLHAQDGIRFSCTRVEKGKINAQGKRLAPLLLSIGSENPVKIAGVKSACRRAFPHMRCNFKPNRITNHAPEQPIGFAQTWNGAKTRAKTAFANARGEKGGNNADYGVGLESGLIKFGNVFFDIQFCCLYDGCEFTAGSSMGFPISEKIMARVANGESLGDAVSEISGIKNIGRKGGALAYLSGGMLHRREMVEQAFLCAMVNRKK